jgi:demethoxyubiquinone hydroxylase (CLK1/Coq7/Cat5 family)
MTEVQASIDKLNEFLRGEIAAVETYDQALNRMHESDHRGQLERCKRSHQMRVHAIRQRITEAGGRPVQSAGVWGAFSRLLEAGASTLGEKAAIAALEEGEDHGLKIYRDDMAQLGASARRFVETELLPAQEATHRSLSALMHSLH